ncbi:ABC transporter permease [Rheinheimera sp. MMS21-TC3]|uniref:ABC transporter permease n=1 Tax=Rheinheimera sp. MMS21-TC3 TaxID=3072790 RepID=UPI0028C40DE3|nr:ABC transporter permease [Rheinheimera sp. MMS21-TC3]WNO59755.1 ABC transporter permease [Rheinheimera sp. MMS21-TC3]
MKLSPLITDTLAELAQHKLRTFLTLLGMIFGVGAVIAMLNIGEGAEREALKTIETMGLRNLIVEGRTFDEKTLQEQRKHSLGLNQSDIDIAVATLRDVTAYSAELKVDTYNIYSHQGKSDGVAIGVSPSYMELSKLAFVAGRNFTEQENRYAAQVAILGARVAKSLFPNGDALGKAVKVNHVWLQVVGVLAEPYAGSDDFQGIKLGGEQNQLFMPLLSAQTRFKQLPMSAELSSFRLQLAEHANNALTAKALDALLKQRHNDIDDYTIIVPAALLAQQKQTQQIFNIVMSCVAGISLLVGGIGIMNIMLATVLERTKEIGLLRAIGATQRDIKLQFVAESFAIAILGGLLGIVFGILLSELIAFYSDWAVSWSLLAIGLSFSICALIGVAFGVYPAIKASQLDPITALQSE